MLEEDPLRARIIERFDDMSQQLQQAARHVLEHPQEVALVSMRELARNAGVQPSTMTRLAKYLGFSGYEDIRAHHAEVIRVGSEGFAAKAQQRSESGQSTDAESFAQRMFQSLTNQIARLCEPNQLARLSVVADRLHSARKVYVLGLRSCHSVAWHFHYVMSLLGEKTVHLDGPAGTGGDALIRATTDDVMLAISINPYAVQTLELVGMAQEKGIGIVSITDSEVSPLVSMSEHVVLCTTDSPTFFHTLTPALAISEVLCGLLANKDRSASLKALKSADQHLQSLNTYSATMPRRKF